MQVLPTAFEWVAAVRRHGRGARRAAGRGSGTELADLTHSSLVLCRTISTMIVYPPGRGGEALHHGAPRRCAAGARGR